MNEVNPLFGDDAGPGDATLRARLRLGAVLTAAALIGFGIIMWVASNWDSFDKLQRFALIGGTYLLACLIAASRVRLRIPGALIAFCAIGALFAAFGQVYQSGADPWQLFALWAALGLPLALVARHDVVWIPWVAVANVGIALWLSANASGLGHTQGIYSAWLMLVALTSGLYWLGTRTGAEGSTRWAFNLAALLTIGTVTAYTVESALAFDISHAVYWPGLLLLAAAFLGFYRMQPMCYTLMSAATLGIDIALICGLNAFFGFISRGEHAGSFLLIGLLSTAIVGGSASLLLRLAPKRSGDAAQQSTSARVPAWSVTALSGIGAIFAAVPFLAMYFALFGGQMMRDQGNYLLALGTMGGAIAMLRTAKPLSFRQQFGFIILVSGAMLLAVGLFGDLPFHIASLVLFALTIGCAALLPIGWIRTVLGAFGAACAIVFMTRYVDLHFGLGLVESAALTANLLVLIAVAILFGRHATADETPQTPLASMVASYTAGFAAIALLSLALSAGKTLLLGGIGFSPIGTGAFLDTAVYHLDRVLSVGCLIVGALLLDRRTGAVRTPTGLTVLAVLAILSTLTSNLGVALLAFVVMLLNRRRPLMLLSAIVALWVIGSFYYWLGWPLVHKAYLLFALGVALALVLAMTRAARQADTVPSSRMPMRPALAAGLILLSAAATAGVFAQGTMRKEAILRDGRPLFIALAPVDPRSLVQGDYMALRFKLPSDKASNELLWNSKQVPFAIATLDERKVATIQRLTHEATAPAGNDIVLRLKRKNRQWMLGTDAWFFREGTAKTFEAAKFGEFRVAPNGEMILVGMADEALKPLK